MKAERIWNNNTQKDRNYPQNTKNIKLSTESNGFSNICITIRNYENH